LTDLRSETSDVLITPQLRARIPREPDYQAESEAFRDLSASLASGSAAVVDTLAGLAFRLCHADSAGITLRDVDEDGALIFRHISVAGELAGLTRTTDHYQLMEAASPDGTIGAPRLLDRPGRALKYLETLAPRLYEALVVPIAASGQEIGSIWVASNTPERQFDSHDVDLLETLGQIAASVVMQQAALEAATHAVLEREELLSIGSHELRNPLTTVVGFASRLARRDDLPEDAQEEVRLVARESDRLRRIIDDFFDLAKLESSAFSLDRQPVDLVELLHEQVTALRIRHPDVAVDEEFDDLPDLQTDASRVAQILGNLLENAAKDGGEDPQITTRLFRDGDVHIEVTDRGLGIPASEHERIFDRSYRLHQRDGATREGLGIGLYIAREFARRLGGSLTVESAPGQGSTFTLTLPLEA
jgi:signal transduction histidine kinase